MSNPRRDTRSTFYFPRARENDPPSIREQSLQIMQTFYNTEGSGFGPQKGRRTERMNNTTSVYANRTRNNFRNTRMNQTFHSKMTADGRGLVGTHASQKGDYLVHKSKQMINKMKNQNYNAVNRKFNLDYPENRAGFFKSRIQGSPNHPDSFQDVEEAEYFREHSEIGTKFTLDDIFNKKERVEFSDRKLSIKKKYIKPKVVDFNALPVHSINELEERVEQFTETLQNSADSIRQHYKFFIKLMRLDKNGFVNPGIDARNSISTIEQFCKVLIRKLEREYSRKLEMIEEQKEGAIEDDSLNLINEISKKIIDFSQRKFVEYLTQECHEYASLQSIIYQSMIKLHERMNTSIGKERDHYCNLLEQFDFEKGPAKVLEARIYDRLKVRFER